MTDQMEASLARATNVTRYYAALAQMRVMEVERDEAREELEAMREAINEAAQVLGKCATWPSRCDFSDSANFALAKLQPFIP